MRHLKHWKQLVFGPILSIAGCGVLEVPAVPEDLSAPVTTGPTGQDQTASEKPSEEISGSNEDSTQTPDTQEPTETEQPDSEQPSETNKEDPPKEQTTETEKEDPVKEAAPTCEKNGKRYQVGELCGKLSQKVKKGKSPSKGWKDSFSADGKCYCDSNGYDHGVKNMEVCTAAGCTDIPTICERIGKKKRPSGAPIYNDIQCGNGPQNDAGDEHPSACPGRVDKGIKGCKEKGPKWDLSVFE